MRQKAPKDTDRDGAGMRRLIHELRTRQVELEERAAACDLGLRKANEQLRKEVEGRSRVEGTLRRLVEFDGIMTRVLGRFASCALEDIDGSVVSGLESIARFIGADHAYVLIVGPDKATWSATHEWCAPHVPSVIHKYRELSMGTLPWSERKILSGETIKIKSMDEYPLEAMPERLNHQMEGTLSVLNIPIRGTNGQISGCIGVRTHGCPVAWSEDDVLRLKMIGDTIAGLLDRKRAEKALRDREERFRLSLNGSAMGAWDWDIPTGEVVYFRHWAEMLGYPPDERDNSTRSWLKWIHPDDRERAKQALEDHLEGKTPLYFAEKRILAKSGEWRWLLFRGRVIKRDGEGRPLRAVGVHLDITERKEAEEQFRKSEANLRIAEAKYRSIFENALEGIYQSSAEGSSMVVNPAMARILGYDSPEEVVAALALSADRVWVDPELREEYTRMIEQEEVVRGFECRFFRKDRAMIWVSLNSRTIRGPDGQTLYYAGFIEDVTERKRIETELQEKLREIEELKEQLEAESAYLQEEIKLEHNFEDIIGRSDALKYVLYRVQQVAATEMAVLILGETGTGKELIARAIHENSFRRARPMVKVNCAVLPAGLIESELFGHEKGAFTGAAVRKIGRFELAGNTTLFLDEIGELPLELQAKLLRVLEEGEFERLGGTQTIKVNPRIIAATNRNLEREMHEGRFRADLWYRLNVYPITVPPLRERTEDIPLMVIHFVEKHGKQLGKNIQKIPARLVETLKNHTWPGNVRELKHVIERAVVNSQDATLHLTDDLFGITDVRPPAANGDKTLEEMEREYILEILAKTSWKIEGKSGAAEILDLNPGTLRSRMKKLGIRKNRLHGLYLH